MRDEKSGSKEEQCTAFATSPGYVEQDPSIPTTLERIIALDTYPSRQ